MTRTEANRRRQPGDRDAEYLALGGALTATLILVTAVWVSARLAGGDVADNPLTYLILLLTGRVAWPAGATLVLLGITAVLTAVAVPAVRAVRARMKSRTFMINRASSLSTAQDTAELREAGARADAHRLGCPHAGTGSPLGRHGRDNAPLWASYEWVQVWIMGPRAGKTTCVCVRQVLETTGPVVATSNKRDIVDKTRGPRSEQGAVWVFDPQGIIGEAPTWWFDPLALVTGIAEADELAALFVASQRDAGAKTDAYFDNEGKALLATMLLAAAAGQRPITQVFTWLTDPDDAEPSKILAEAGHQIASDSLFAMSRLTPKQRDGVYGTARAMVSFLRNEKVLPWVTTTGPDDKRPRFAPSTFVRSRQTIYLISREGRGTARALTAALTVAIVTVAEEVASHSPRGRLATPLTVVLDEAANVCRWPELPDLYSHFGSRGIVISTFLQSYAQGVEVWGENGMRKLWSAANIRVVGSGLAEDRFLGELSHLIGERDVVQRSSNRGKGGRSVSSSLHREPILSVGDLAKIPRGWGVMLSSGMPATVLRLVHYGQAPYADKIEASEVYYSSLLSTAGATTSSIGNVSNRSVGVPERGINT